MLWRMPALSCTNSRPALRLAALKLGCLNHAQLTRLGVEARGVSFARWIAGSVDPAMAQAAVQPLAQRAINI